MNLTDKDSFERIFRDLYKPLCRFVIGINKNQSEAEDIVQDVFINLWSKRNELIIQQSVKAYLYKACYNRVLSQIKFRIDFTNLEEAENTVLSERNVLDNINFNDTKNKLDVAIEKLPSACRTIFLLSRMEELSYKEIAQSLGISVSTVESQMVKALKILRGVIEVNH